MSESYPPLFRQTGASLNRGVDDDRSAKQSPEYSGDPLPLIDFQCVSQEKLYSACKDWGVFRLVNHGIPVTLLNQLHHQTKQLFDLSFESKQALFTSPVAYFWGTPALTPSGTLLERDPQAQNVNWVEGFNVPLSQLSQQPPREVEEPLLDSFRLVLEEYGRHQSRLATTIFEAMAETLKLDQRQTESYLSPTTGLLRVYRYPPCPADTDASGMDVHTDSSVISILNQYEVGGLQVYKHNQWLDVQPISNTLVVNLGDMMQAISNDECTSVKHRVKLNKKGKERISIGYFVFPAEGSVIESSRYRPFTYGDFRAQVQQDLKTIGIKVGLQRFKLTEACSVQGGY